MKETEKLGSVKSQKDKIRERYKGIDTDQLDVIPALPQDSFYEDKREKRVAVYARVSTDDPRQTSSYELQKNHYQDVVTRHPGWRLIEIYADEGISGTSLQHRDSFLRMIEDCHADKIDLIVTKSVSRFARNVLDCIGYVRQLAALNPPIGIFFETENIYTLNSNSEMSLSFISTLAQEESHTKSEIMNASIEMRFRRAIFLTPPLLGFDQDEDGNLVINEEEAKTVRLIFFMYLYGYTCQEIAEMLTNLGRKTKLNNTVWSAGSVLQQLQNERHCGDVLARKTWTPNYLDHKSKKNRQDRNQYRQKNHHEPIISRDDFIAVQRLISNAKYGNRGFLPDLHVFTSGALRGFVSVNPRWAGFKAADYTRASESIYDQVIQLPEQKVEVNSGDFDLRGFEVARAQFFSSANRVYVTFSITGIRFSTECVRKLDSHYVEILVHPGNKMIALKPTTKSNRNSIEWSRQLNGAKIPKQVSGAAFLPNLFDLFHWDTTCKYRVLGFKKQNSEDALVLFNWPDAEVLIPNSTIENEEEESKALFKDDVKPLGTRGSTFGYPEEWIYSFGNSYYRQAQANELAAFNEENWTLKEEKASYNPDPPLQVTTHEEIKESIQTIIDGMRQEANND